MVGTQTTQVTVTQATEESIDIEPLQGATVGEARPYFETGAIVGPGIANGCANWSGNPSIPPYGLEGVATYGDEVGGGGGNPGALSFSCNAEENPDAIHFNIHHVYSDPGTYPVKVKIADDNGVVGTQTTQVTVTQ